MKTPDLQTLRAALGRLVAVAVMLLSVFQLLGAHPGPAPRRAPSVWSLFAEVEVAALPRRNHPVKIGFDLRELGSDSRTRVLVFA